MYNPQGSRRGGNLVAGALHGGASKSHMRETSSTGENGITPAHNKPRAMWSACGRVPPGGTSTPLWQSAERSRGLGSLHHSGTHTACHLPSGNRQRTLADWRTRHDALTARLCIIQ